MQSTGYSDKDCEEFFTNCIDQLLHWKKIQLSTSINWKKWIKTICKKFRNEERIQIDDMEEPFFCVEVLTDPFQFQNVMQHTQTEAPGQQGRLSNTTVANYMQMITYIMKNISICTDDEDIINYKAFTPQNIKKWEHLWGSLQIDATYSRHYEITQKIINCEADWGEIINITKKNYLENPNDLYYVNSYLLVLTYDTLCARNDYNDCVIYTRGQQIPLSLRRTTNYIDLNTLTIHVNDTKNRFEIGKNEYPTYQYLSEEYLNVLARSLRLFPRHYLFVTENGGKVRDLKFGDEYIKPHLGWIYKTQQNNSLINGCDIIRHLFAQYYYRLSREAQFQHDDSEHESKGVELFENSIMKMLHSQSTHMENYISPYLSSHSTKLQDLDNKTRTFHIDMNNITYTREINQLNKLLFLCKRFNDRIEQYEEDYEDVFGKENFNMKSESILSTLEQYSSDNDTIMITLRYYKDLLKHHYPDKTDLENELPVGCSLESEEVPENSRDRYNRFIRNKQLLPDHLHNNTTDSELTNTQASLMQQNTQDENSTPIVMNNSDTYALRSLSTMPPLDPIHRGHGLLKKHKGNAFFKVKVPKKHFHGIQFKFY
ncbi:hypothetical protein WA158_003346 [Blastocystis sp. Blastoise]